MVLHCHTGVVRVAQVEIDVFHKLLIITMRFRLYIHSHPPSFTIKARVQRPSTLHSVIHSQYTEWSLLILFFVCLFDQDILLS